MIGGATQSLSPEKIREGIVILLAAEIAEGLVSAAAKFIRVLILGLFSAARKLAPPPIECPNIPVFGNTEL